MRRAHRVSVLAAKFSATDARGDLDRRALLPRQLALHATRSALPREYPSTGSLTAAGTSNAAVYMPAIVACSPMARVRCPCDAASRVT